VCVFFLGLSKHYGSIALNGSFLDGSTCWGCYFIVSFPCLVARRLLCWLWGKLEGRGGYLINERLLGVGWKLTYTLELMAVHVEFVFSYGSAVMDAGPWMMASFGLLSYDIAAILQMQSDDPTQGYSQLLIQ